MGVVRSLERAIVEHLDDRYPYWRSTDPQRRTPLPEGMVLLLSPDMYVAMYMDPDGVDFARLTAGTFADEIVPAFRGHLSYRVDPELKGATFLLAIITRKHEVSGGIDIETGEVTDIARSF